MSAPADNQYGSDREASKRTLLIVDDEEMIHRALVRTLRREPYDFLHAYDAAEAWVILGGHAEVDGVLCDHYMPGTHGLDLLLGIRKRYERIVTVLVTAQADIQLAMNAINEGHIHLFVAKPWEGPTLRAQLRALLFEGTHGSASAEHAARKEEELLEELRPMLDAESGVFLIHDPTTERS